MSETWKTRGIATSPGTYAIQGRRYGSQTARLGLADFHLIWTRNDTNAKIIGQLVFRSSVLLHGLMDWLRHPTCSFLLNFRGEESLLPMSRP